MCLPNLVNEIFINSCLHGKNMSTEFESLLSTLLEQKPDLSRSTVNEMIQQKKEKIGAGYLTDQGALFLIASDLGISLSEPLRVEMKLKDLYVGAKEITLQTRVMSLSPPKQFLRKDGSQLVLRNMIVYDSDSRASVKLWEENASLPSLEKLKPGDLIKIIKAYVKSDLRGNPTINIGSGATIEKSESESDIPSIDSITTDVSSLKEDQHNLVVSGLIDGSIRYSEFTTFRGQPGKALHLRLKGQDKNSIRVVLWGKDESSIPKMIVPGAKSRLIGVRTKIGKQGLEIHGDESTFIEIEGEDEIKSIIIRILSITKNEQGTTLILAVDKNKKLFNIKDSSDVTKNLKTGETIECMPSKVYGNSISLESNSYLKKIDGENLPSVSDLRTKIREIKPSNSPYCIEAIVLKLPERKEVQTRTGESVALSQILIEDDTGQIWLKGWRNQARMIDTCSLGEIISIGGVTAKVGLEGKVELTLSPFSVITKKN